MSENSQENNNQGNSGDQGQAGQQQQGQNSQEQNQQQSQQSQSGYTDVTNQNASGYNEQQPDDKDKGKESKFKFDKEGHDEKSTSLVEKFAELNGLNEKQVEGFSNFIKDLRKQSETAKNGAVESAKKAQFAAMQADLATLKSHPEFGKDLEQSFMQANKVLDLMPEYKKVLTEGGKHIDARFMIGLKGLYSKLYGQDGTLVLGEKADQKSNLPIEDQIYGKRSNN